MAVYADAQTESEAGTLADLAADLNVPLAMLWARVEALNR